MKILKPVLAVLLTLGLSLSGKAQSQEPPVVIEICSQMTTHVVFRTDLTYVDISSSNVIVAKIVDASKNMLALKALKAFDFTTTVSALEVNGTMHTFYVKYNEKPANLVVDTRVSGSAPGGVTNTQNVPVPVEVPQANATVSQPQVSVAGSQTAQVQQSSAYGDGRRPGRRTGRNGNGTGQTTGRTGVNVSTEIGSSFGKSNAPSIETVMKIPQEIFHIADRDYRLTVMCDNIFAYSDMTYIILSLENGSAIGFDAGDAMFTIETRRKRKAELSTDKNVWPKSSYGTLSCQPGGVTMVGYTFPKITLLKSQVLKAYIYEKGGNRNMTLTFTDRDLNYAVAPDDVNHRPSRAPKPARAARAGMPQSATRQSAERLMAVALSGGYSFPSALSLSLFLEGGTGSGRWFAGPSFIFGKHIPNGECESVDGRPVKAYSRVYSSVEAGYLFTLVGRDGNGFSLSAGASAFAGYDSPALGGVIDKTYTVPAIEGTVPVIPAGCFRGGIRPVVEFAFPIGSVGRVFARPSFRYFLPVSAGLAKGAFDFSVGVSLNL